MDSKRKEDILLVGAGLTGLTFCNFIKNSKLFADCKASGELPFKSIIYAPSNSGKTVLITNLIEHVYKA